MSRSSHQNLAAGKHLGARLLRVEQFESRQMLSGEGVELFPTGTEFDDSVSVIPLTAEIENGALLISMQEPPVSVGLFDSFQFNVSKLRAATATFSTNAAPLAEFDGDFAFSNENQFNLNGREMSVTPDAVGSVIGRPQGGVLDHDQVTWESNGATSFDDNVLGATDEAFGDLSAPQAPMQRVPVAPEGRAEEPTGLTAVDLAAVIEGATLATSMHTAEAQIRSTTTPTFLLASNTVRPNSLPESGLERAVVFDSSRLPDTSADDILPSGVRRSIPHNASLDTLEPSVSEESPGSPLGIDFSSPLPEDRVSSELDRPRVQRVGWSPLSAAVETLGALADSTLEDSLHGMGDGAVAHESVLAELGEAEGELVFSIERRAGAAATVVLLLAADRVCRSRSSGDRKHEKTRRLTNTADPSCAS